MRAWKDEKGMTLIELLAVIVILGIVAAIASIAMSSVIEKSRAQAFVGNAYAMYEAARLHVGAQNVEFLQPNQSETLTYKQLVEDGVLEPMKDPYTSRQLSPETNESYVLVKKTSAGSLQYAICLKGETKQLCSYNETQNEIPVEELDVTLIKDVE
jgi:prepilin-type N-terminal cleavage/methylation domain-containing protein